MLQCVLQCVFMYAAVPCADSVLQCVLIHVAARVCICCNTCCSVNYIYVALSCADSSLQCVFVHVAVQLIHSAVRVAVRIQICWFVLC